MKSAIVAAVCVALATSVDGHAVLNSLNGVAPYNVKESRTGPCGGGTAPAAVALVVDPGATINGVWSVNAGDGVGAISAKIDGGAGVAFNTVLTLEGDLSANKLGKFPFTFTAPAADACTGTVGARENVCTIQVKSTSNWYSCIQLAVNAPPPPPVPDVAPPPPPPPPPTDKCEVLANLGFCADFNGKMAVLPAGKTAALMDAEAKQSYDDTKGNTNVFRSGTVPACAGTGTDPKIPWLKNLICGDLFKSCDPTAAGVKAVPKSNTCNTRCRATANACSLDPSHSGVYGCDNAKYSEITADILGACNTVSIPQPSPIIPQTRAFPWTNGQLYAEMFVYGGDTLTFQFQPGAHDLWRFADKAAFDACDFSTATAEASSSVLLLGDAGTQYYGCKIAGHCQAGQKVAVTLKAGGVCTQQMNDKCAAMGKGPCTGTAECSPGAAAGGAPTPVVIVNDDCSAYDCATCITNYQKCNYCNSLAGTRICTSRVGQCTTVNGSYDTITNINQCAGGSTPNPNPSPNPNPANPGSTFINPNSASVVGASILAVVVPVLALFL